MSNDGAESVPKILIFTRTLGYRHDSIPIASSALAEWGTETGLWDSVHTEDTGEVISGSQITAFRKWLQNGGNFASMKASHAATNALTESFYGNLTGAFFSGHPEIQSATYQVCNSTHPAVSTLPATWEHYDEIYPRENNIILLLSAIQSSYRATATSGGVVSPIQLTPGGPPQPIAWFRDAGHQLAPDLIHNGRLFQTGLGHAKET
ncbi:hypothetical protein ZTR_07604 [Talaromyces verruculosus]|nr:hypothetical protein ZTR_07604 [Talaromyces verruculosus]